MTKGQRLEDDFMIMHVLRSIYNVDFEYLRKGPQRLYYYAVLKLVNEVILSMKACVVGFNTPLFRTDITENVSSALNADQQTKLAAIEAVLTQIFGIVGGDSASVAGRARQDDSGLFYDRLVSQKKEFQDLLIKLRLKYRLEII